MKWLSAALQVVDKIPFEKLFIKPPSNKKSLQELQEILSGGVATPVKELHEPTVEDEIPDEEDLHGFLQPRQQKVHLERNSDEASAVTAEETVNYQNRELGKLLLRMERHYAQKLMINGKKCDCGSSKHLLDIEALAEETVGMVDNPDIYYRLLEWVKDVGPKSTVTASASGDYDEDYPAFSRQSRDLRKELLGTLEAKALFGQQSEEKTGEEPENNIN